MIPAVSDTAIATACAALASPVRRAIMVHLFEVEPMGINAGALAAVMALAPHAALSHLNTLVAAGLACAVRVNGAIVYRGCLKAIAIVFSTILERQFVPPPCAQTPCDVYFAR